MLAGKRKKLTLTWIAVTICLSIHWLAFKSSGNRHVIMHLLKKDIKVCFKLPNLLDDISDDPQDKESHTDEIFPSGQTSLELTIAVDRLLFAKTNSMNELYPCIKIHNFLIPVATQRRSFDMPTSPPTTVPSFCFRKKTNEEQIKSLHELLVRY